MKIINAKTLGAAPNPPNSVYVGRPTKWGNPFSHMKHTGAQWKVDTREEAIAKFEEWLLQQPKLMKALHELRGKDLICWCAPEACHAEVLMRLANA